MISCMSQMSAKGLDMACKGNLECIPACRMQFSGQQQAHCKVSGGMFGSQRTSLVTHLEEQQCLARQQALDPCVLLAHKRLLPVLCMPDLDQILQASASALSLRKSFSFDACGLKPGVKHILLAYLNADTSWHNHEVLGQVRFTAQPLAPRVDIVEAVAELLTEEVLIIVSNRALGKACVRLKESKG